MTIRTGIRHFRFWILGGGSFIHAMSASDFPLDHPGAEGGLPMVSTFTVNFNDNSFGFFSHKLINSGFVGFEQVG